MSILINGMEIPKDCPMCIAAHYNKLDEFTGCEIVSGKKHAAQRDAEYAKSSTRPDWCPLIPVPPHGRCIDADALKSDGFHTLVCYTGKMPLEYTAMSIDFAPTIIPAEEEMK